MNSYFIEVDKQGIVKNVYLSFSQSEDFHIEKDLPLAAQDIPKPILSIMLDFHTGNQRLKLVQNIPVREAFFDLKLTRKDDDTICIINNVTVDNIVRKELESNRNALRVLVDSTYDTIWSFDRNFNITAANKAFFDLRRRLHQTHLQLGDNIFKNVPESSKQKWMPIYQKVLDDGSPVIFEEKRTSYHQEQYVVVSLNPIKDERGNIIGCMGITHDITALKQQKDISFLESQIIRCREKLEQDVEGPLLKLRQKLLDLKPQLELSSDQATIFQHIDEIQVGIAELLDIAQEIK